jgi:lipid A 3-O-deacylase
VRHPLTAFAAAVIFAAVLPSHSLAQDSNWNGWTLTWENDTFAFFTPETTDARYTNGIRFTLARNEARNWERIDAFGEWWRIWSPLAREARPHTTTSALTFGQTFFTPSVITSFDPDPLDRPYAAFTYAGLHVDVTEDPPPEWIGAHARLQHSFELNLGVFGPPAAAEEVQTGVHVIRRAGNPKGWSHQVYTEPAVAFSYQARARLGWHFLDFVPQVGVLAGTAQTYAHGGLIARVGWNLSGFPALLIRPTAEPDDTGRRSWEAGLMAGVEGRAFAHNAFLDGSLFQGGPSVPSEALVGDFTAGATLRLEDWRLSYTYVRRSPEIAGDTPFAGDSPFAGVYHNYGSVSFAHEPGARTVEDQREGLLGRVLHDWLGPVFRRSQFEAALGPGQSRTIGNRVEDGALQGISMRLGVGIEVQDWLVVGYETGGIVREGRRPLVTGDAHTDVVLSNGLVTAQLRPLGSAGRTHLLYLRGGAGSSARYFEARPAVGKDATPAECLRAPWLDTSGGACSREETGRSYMAGAGYAYRLGRQASVGVEASWHWMTLDDLDADPRYVTAGIVVRFHPGG